MQNTLLFARDYIFHWEDGQSSDPAKTHSMRRNDGGNWTGGSVGSGVLVGSNHGVTPAALAKYRRIPVARITYAGMHALTLDEAVAIAVAHYFHEPRLDLLPWNAVTAALMDFVWGAGVDGGLKMLQRRVLGFTGKDIDGDLGPRTIAAFEAWVARLGESAAAAAFCQARYAFYDAVIAAKPHLAEDRNGWRARAAYFTATSPWWARFHK